MFLKGNSFARAHRSSSYILSVFFPTLFFVFLFSSASALFISCGKSPVSDGEKAKQGPPSTEDILKYANALLDFSVFSSLLSSNLLFLINVAVHGNLECIKKDREMNIYSIDCENDKGWSFKGDIKVSGYSRLDVSGKLKIIGEDGGLRASIDSMKGVFSSSFDVIKLEIEHIKMVLPEEKNVEMRNFSVSYSGYSVKQEFQESVAIDGGEKISFENTQIYFNLMEFSLHVTGYIFYDGCIQAGFFVESGKILFDPNSVFPVNCPAEGKIKLTLSSISSYQVEMKSSVFLIGSKKAFSCDDVAKLSCNIAW